MSASPAGKRRKTDPLIDEKTRAKHFVKSDIARDQLHSSSSSTNSKITPSTQPIPIKPKVIQPAASGKRVALNAQQGKSQAVIDRQFRLPDVRTFLSDVGAPGTPPRHASPLSRTALLGTPRASSVTFPVANSPLQSQGHQPIMVTTPPQPSHMYLQSPRMRSQSPHLNLQMQSQPPQLQPNPQLGLIQHHQQPQHNQQLAQHQQLQPTQQLAQQQNLQISGTQVFPTSMVPQNVEYNQEYIERMSPNLANSILNTANSFGYSFPLCSDKPSPAQQQDIVNALHVLGQSGMTNIQLQTQHLQQTAQQSATVAGNQAPTAASNTQLDPRGMSAMADKSAKLQKEEAARAKTEKASKKSKKDKRDVDSARTSSRTKKKPDRLQVSSTEENEESQEEASHKKSKKNKDSRK